MQLCKVQLETGEVRAAALVDGHVRLLQVDEAVGRHILSDVLHSDNPRAAALDLMNDDKLAPRDVDFLAPIDLQEVWAAGVTYKRSQEARERESAGAAKFYDLVYSA